MSVDDGQYYIGNPGSAYSQLLQRALPNAGFTNPVCATCPNLPKAIRDYDGIEFRLETAPAEKFFGSISYTYSKLNGNYPGLNSTYFLDGGGGRHEPNNNRSFDLPQMLFDAHGHPVGGPLPTDRPNSFFGFGYYRLKWFGQETLIGLQQQFSSGSPQSTCLPTVDSQSSCMFVEGQGNWVNFHQAANGDIIRDSITQNKRTPWLSQSDLSLTHELHVSKDHEQMRLSFNVNCLNCLNQRIPLALYNSPLATGWTTPAPTAAQLALNAGAPADYLTMMTNFDYMSLINVKNTTSNTNGKPNTLASRYGAPIIYTAARNMRLQMKFTF